MKNIAILFAGGTGQRMNTKTKPKQFLELHGKPLLAYTIDIFQNHEEIDAIVLITLDNWINYCEGLQRQYGFDKLNAIIPGGDSGQHSIRNGVMKAYELFGGDNIVLIHDGVRPLVDAQTISNSIALAREKGCAITVSPATETIAMKGIGNSIETIVNRNDCVMARAPQCFFLGDLFEAHKKADAEGYNGFIDTGSMMQYYGHELFYVEGNPENIKITTPIDFYMFRAILEARENSQIFG